MLSIYSVVLCGIILYAKTSAFSECTFQNETLKNICDWSSWLPWDCTQCSMSAYSKAIRKRAICCEKDISKDTCLKNCGYNQTSDTEYGQCQSRCGVSHNQGTTERYANGSSVLFSFTTVLKMFSSGLQTTQYHSSDAVTSTTLTDMSSFRSISTYVSSSTETTTSSGSSKTSTIRTEDFTSLSPASNKAVASSEKQHKTSSLPHQTAIHQDPSSSNERTTEVTYHLPDSTDVVTTATVTDMSSSRSIFTSLGPSTETASSLNSPKAPTARRSEFTPLSPASIKAVFSSKQPRTSSLFHQTTILQDSASSNEKPAGVTEKLSTETTYKILGLSAFASYTSTHQTRYPVFHLRPKQTSHGVSIEEISTVSNHLNQFWQQSDKSRLGSSTTSYVSSKTFSTPRDSSVAKTNKDFTSSGQSTIQTATYKHSKQRTTFPVFHQSTLQVNCTSLSEGSTETASEEHSFANTHEKMTLQFTDTKGLSSNTPAFTLNAIIQSLSSVNTKDILSSTKSASESVVNIKYKLDSAYSTNKMLMTHKHDTTTSDEPPVPNTQNLLATGISSTLSHKFSTQRHTLGKRRSEHTDLPETSISPLYETTFSPTDTNINKQFQSSQEKVYSTEIDTAIPVWTEASSYGIIISHESNSIKNGNHIVFYTSCSF